ncbi:MAG: hypothetical protein KQH79_11475 [Bacteroidetes bacterium]|nr:hypothetical protein [Bacteroidota bacterium]
MLKILVRSFLLLFISVQSFGQMVQFIEKDSTFKNENKTEEFHFINNGFDYSNSKFVASMNGLSLNSENNNLVSLFETFKFNANYLGANAFHVDEYKISDSKDSVSVSVSFYYLNLNELIKNSRLYSTNMVYVIGDVSTKKSTGRKIKFNKNTIQLLPLEYVSYQNKVGEDAILSIGGILGSKVWIRGKENREPKFLSLQGFGMGGGFTPNGQITVSISTGQIYPVNLDLGLFLTKILNRKTY